MWLMLGTTILALGLAETRPKAARPSVLVTGTIATIIQGMLGMATGLLMVSRHYHQFPDPMAALGEGLGEASHNGTFAGILATLLGLAALVSARSAAREA
jgi:hypothetical protein